MYGNFAGRDASRGMAKQSFDLGTSLSLTVIRILLTRLLRLDMLTPIDQPLDKLGDLTPEEMSVLSLFPLILQTLTPFLS